MSDFHLVDPQGWEYDLQSVYSAYIGFFQLHGVPWHDRTWGQFFETFEQFLAFSWPVITVTDTRTGRAHIVTRMSSITAFLKMVKARFGETLPRVDNMLLVTPFETTQRHLRHVSDGSTYKKLHAALPAVALAALKARIRLGEPNTVRQFWAARDKTFLALDFKSVEGHVRACVEWGYAAIRSSHLVAAGAWPPVPDTNYRKGHYVISEYANTVENRAASASWQYAFGESQVVPTAKMPCIIQSVLSLMSPDSETVSNTVVLVAHGVQVILRRLDEMKIKLPTNVLALDIAHLERALFTSGDRGPMHDRRTGQARVPGSLLSLGSLLRSFGIEARCVLGNAGNDAFMALIAFQRMVDPRGVVGSWGASGGGAADGVVGTGVRNGKSAKGSGKGGGNGTVSNGPGHARRAATVAARIFRPLSSVHPDANAKPGPNGHGELSHLRHSRYSVGSGGVDEMGKMHRDRDTSLKRASMFSALRSPSLVPSVKLKKRASQASTNGSGGGWTMSTSTIVPGQRRLSVVEERR